METAILDEREPSADRASITELRSDARAVATSADVELPRPRNQRLDPAWENWIDKTLAQWARDPGQVEEEGTITPSPETIARAIEAARRFRDAGAPAPTRIVADAHGGIVFELQHGDVFETFRIHADGSRESCLFRNGTLVILERW